MKASVKLGSVTDSESVALDDYSITFNYRYEVAIGPDLGVQFYIL